MITLKNHRAPDGIENIRLVDYVIAVFPEMHSRSFAKKAIKRGEVLLDGEQTSQGVWLKPQQVISLVDLQNKPPKIFEFKLEVVFEDDFIAVINKPAGIAVSGNKYKTIGNALPFNLKPSAKADALKRPLPVHRLDFPTSGLLLVAKTHAAHIGLGQQFEQRLVDKTYRSIVVGLMPEQGVIDHPLDGQEAVTLYRLVESFPSLKVGTLSLIELMPRTGRTHQLRRHLADTGFPVVGDSKYGMGKPLLKGKGLFLCAIGLQFLHPVTKEPCRFSVQQPLKFASLMARESRRWKKYNT